MPWYCALTKKARSRHWNAVSFCRWGSVMSRVSPIITFDMARPRCSRRSISNANGTVIGQCKARHRHQELLSFLNHLEKSVPAALDVHLVMDNYGTHKHPKVRAWFARRPRFHVHFTPTYASWLNQVERWFGLISQRAIKRGSFRNVKDLVAHIERYIAQHNANPIPFAWTATADSILKKLARLSKLLCGTAH